MLRAHHLGFGGGRAELGHLRQATRRTLPLFLDHAFPLRAEILFTLLIGAACLFRLSLGTTESRFDALLLLQRGASLSLERVGLTSSSPSEASLMETLAVEEARRILFQYR